MKIARGIAPIIILAGFIFFSQFYRLDFLSYRIYDESRLVNSAFEISQNGHFLTPTYDGKEDIYYTKPPLMLWCQAASIKAFGLSEFAGRLPAVLSATITILLLFLFVRRITGSTWAGVSASIILCTSEGYIAHHCSRFGEYDALLVLFTTLYLCSFFLYIQTNGPRKASYLLSFFLFLTLACFTKGIAGLFFAPVLFAYALATKHVMPTLKSRYFYLGAMLFICFIGGYYLLREHWHPGYLKIINENELGGRFGKVIEGTSGPWYFYMQLMYEGRFVVWLWILPASLIGIYFIKEQLTKQLAIFCWLCAVGYMVIISAAQTKQFWYDMPLYPLFAILGAIVLKQIADYIAQRFPKLQPEVALIILVVLLSIYPLRNDIIRIAKDDDTKWENGFNNPEFYHICYFLREHNRKRDLDNTLYLSNEYFPQNKLYIYAAQQQGLHIQGKPFNYPLEKGMRVIADQEGVRQYLEFHYNLSLYMEDRNVRVYDIVGKK